MCAHTHTRNEYTDYIFGISLSIHLFDVPKVMCNVEVEFSATATDVILN